MNIENMDRWIEAVRAEHAAGTDFQFDMEVWRLPIPGVNAHGHPCGTVACLGGTADMLVAADRDLPVWIIDRAHLVEWIGIPAEVLDLIFHPTIEGAYDATPEVGARVLERLRDTGEECWAEIVAQEVPVTKMFTA